MASLVLRPAASKNPKSSVSLETTPVAPGGHLSPELVSCLMVLGAMQISVCGNRAQMSAGRRLADSLKLVPEALTVRLLLLHEVNSQDGLVPSQSPEDVHWSPDLPSLEVQRAIETSNDLYVASAGGGETEPVVWRCFLQGPVAWEGAVLLLQDAGYRRFCVHQEDCVRSIQCSAEVGLSVQDLGRCHAED